MKTVLQPEAVIIQAHAKDFYNEYQNQDVHGDGKSIVLEGGAIGKVSQISSPPRREKYNKEKRANANISNPQPTADPVVTPRVGRVRSVRRYSRSSHESVSIIHCRGWESESPGDNALPPISKTMRRLQ